MTYTPQNNLETIDGQIVDPKFAVECEMRDARKVHNAQR